MARRMDLLNQITRQLSVLATEIALENRSNRMTLNSDVETIYCGFVNRLCGWELGNLNEESQNFPGIDLADRKRGIAVQITASATNEKLKHTLKNFFKYDLDRQFQRLILLITTDRAIPRGSFTLERPFDFDPARDIWNVEVLKRKVEAIEDAEHLQMLADYLDGQLGLLPGIRKPEHLLPPVPAACEGFLEGSRDRELEILEDAVHTGRPVFIWGLGGMGKSQTAIQLANRCAGARGAYFLRYDKSMRETICAANISGYRLEAEGETDREILKERMYREKLEILRREYENTILVIDNFNVDDAGLEQLKAEPACQDVLALENLGVHLIFTTRYDPGVAEWEIGPMEEPRLVELMGRYCTDVSGDDMRRLIQAVGGHTLMVELIAKTLEESWNAVTAEQVLDALARARLAQDDFPDVTSDKDGLFRQEQIYHHIQALFNLSGLSEGARRVLSLSPLIAAEGLDDLLFWGALDPADGKELQNLVKRGWLQRTERVITIHPAICQVVRGELCPTEEPVQSFLDKLWALLQKKEYGSETLRRSAQCMGAGAGYISDADSHFDIKKRAMTLWEKILPGDSVEMAQVYSDMGGVYLRRGDYRGALQYKKKAWDIKSARLSMFDLEMLKSAEFLENVKQKISEQNLEQLDDEQIRDVEGMLFAEGIFTGIQKGSFTTPEQQMAVCRDLLEMLNRHLSFKPQIPDESDREYWESLERLQECLINLTTFKDDLKRKGSCVKSLEEYGLLFEEMSARMDKLQDGLLRMGNESNEILPVVKSLLEKMNQKEATPCNED